MNERLTQWGYTLNPHRVWQRPGFEGIAYSDGDEIENRIWNAIRSCNDTRVLSDELKAHCTDWASLYHLSGSRANILRPLAPLLKGDILEIGAGCGAITRFLGEHGTSHGATILALEGSPRRAAIARERSRDLTNVTVLSERFDNFVCQQSFDVVTLIGVLEYANLFTGGPTATLTMLERARQLVKPGGHLIIAIENQLGLKYFAGAPEDHLGVPMYGIEALYEGNHAQTFGQQTLTRLLAQAGFTETEFLAPFPDYKLPVSVVTQAGMDDPAFDASAFAWQNVRRDPQLPAAVHFGQERTWPDLFDNGLGMALSNSFLIVASDQVQPTDAGATTLAWHYSSGRRADLCKVTRFERSPVNGIEVICEPLVGPHFSPAPSVANHGPVELIFAPTPRTAYVPGKCLSWDLVQTITHDGWTPQQLAANLQIWRHVLEETLGHDAANVDWTRAQSRMPGRLFDALPQNIVCTPAGRYVLIDTEWSHPTGVALGHLVLRAMLLLLACVSRVGRPFDTTIRTRLDFVNTALAAMGLSATLDDMNAWMASEAPLQARITAMPDNQFTDWAPTAPLNVSRMVDIQADTVQTLTQTVAVLQAQLQVKDQQLAERDHHLRAVESSSSWRLTGPLRRLMRWLK